MQNNQQYATQEWLVQFPQQTTIKNKVMGWTMSLDPDELEPSRFGTLEEAIDLCNQEGVAYYIEKPNLRKHDRKTYADNFKWKGYE